MIVVVISFHNVRLVLLWVGAENNIAKYYVYRAMINLITFYAHVANFPSAVLEVSESEVKEWLSPKNLMIGKTVNIMGRRLLM